MTKTSHHVLRPGTGLRPVHFPFLETRAPEVVTWFEALSENYLDTKGRPRKMLEFIRERFPVALHGVAMNLASADGVDTDYLKKLKELVTAVDPFVYSDHLCWTAAHGRHSHDLLPFPLTDETLTLVASNVHRVQEAMGRTMAVENVSHYMTFKENTYTEAEFLAALHKRTGAEVLLDINNVYVSATNLGFDPLTYLAAIPSEIVAQVHLAGFSDLGDILFDTHSQAVHAPVWDLFAAFIKRAPDVPFMIEWDEDIPEFPVLEAEVAKACAIWENVVREKTNGSEKLSRSVHQSHARPDVSPTLG